MQATQRPGTEALQRYIALLETERQMLQRQVREHWEPDTQAAYSEGVTQGHADVLRDLQTWQERSAAAEAALRAAQKGEQQALHASKSLRQSRTGWVIVAAAGWLGLAWHLSARWL